MTLNPVGSNQTEVTLSNGTTVFYSYRTPVAVFVPGKGYFKTSEKFSVTTSKHVNRWVDRNVMTVTPDEFRTFLG